MSNWSGDIDLGYLEGSFWKKGARYDWSSVCLWWAARSTQPDGGSATLQIYKGLGIMGTGAFRSRRVFRSAAGTWCSAAGCFTAIPWIPKSGCPFTK